MVPAEPAGYQSEPRVAALASGPFVVVWEDGDYYGYNDGRDGSEQGVFGRLVSRAGVPIGADFAANTYTTGAQGGPAVDALDPTTFVVTWSSVGQEDAPSESNGFARIFQATITTTTSSSTTTSTTTSSTTSSAALP